MCLIHFLSTLRQKKASTIGNNQSANKKTKQKKKTTVHHLLKEWVPENLRVQENKNSK